MSLVAMTPGKAGGSGDLSYDSGPQLGDFIAAPQALSAHFHIENGENITCPYITPVRLKKKT